jgi:hypothetical protein
MSVSWWCSGAVYVPCELTFDLLSSSSLGGASLLADRPHVTTGGRRNPCVQERVAVKQHSIHLHYYIPFSGQSACTGVVVGVAAASFTVVGKGCGDLDVTAKLLLSH